MKIGFNPNRINIYNLTTERPGREPEVFFNVERDITDKDWELMKARLEHYRNANNWLDFSFQAMEMKILDPSIDLNIGEPEIEGMKVDLEHYRGNYWLDFSLQAMRMKILDPSIDLNIGEPEIEGMKAKLEEYRNINNWRAFSFQAMRMKILDSSIDLNIGKPEIEGMKVQLEECRNPNNWSNFSTQAMGMKILVAEKVEITEKGLEITMPKKKKPLRSETPPMPEQRKF